MTDLLKQSFDEEINLKLRTLNLIHWTAIFGQFFAVIIAYFYFEISFSIYFCISLILLSVILNILVSMLASPAAAKRPATGISRLFLMPVTLLSFVFSTAIFCLGVIAWMSKDYVDRVHIEPVLKGLMLYHLLAGVSFFYMVLNNMVMVSIEATMMASVTHFGFFVLFLSFGSLFVFFLSCWGFGGVFCVFF